MKLIDLGVLANELFIVSGDIVACDPNWEGIFTINSNKKISIGETDRFLYDTSRIVLLKNGRAQVLDSELQITDEIESELISSSLANFICLEDSSYLLVTEEYDRSLGTVLRSAIKLKAGITENITPFNRYIINESISIGFDGQTLEDSNKVECIDLLNENTKWAFEVEADAEITKISTICNELFLVTNKQNTQLLTFLNIETGQILWTIEVENGNFVQDSKTNCLVSFWGTKSQGLKCQVIDVINRNYKVWNVKCDVPFEYIMSDSHIQISSNNTIYFVDNVLSSEGEEIKPLKIGGYNYSSKSIVFHEEALLGNVQFSQLLLSKDNLYYLTTDEKVHQYKIK